MPDVDARIREWFASHTHHGPPASLAELVDVKGSRRISVVMPARDEASTIGPIIEAVRTELGSTGLVDEILVVDSRSRDETAHVARQAGATVVPTRDVADDVDDGKGGALRTGIEQMTGDVGVLLDADVREFGTDFVRGLLTPLLRDERLVLVKAFYDRPWDHAGGTGGQATDHRTFGGGRVTELVARPLIAHRAPELAGFVQPLSGECAFVRAALAGQPLVSGYGVDLAMLLQTVHAHGLSAVAQADLGRRLHRHQGLDALGRMALQVTAAVEIVLGDVEEVRTERTVPDRDEHVRLALRTETISTRRLPAPVPGGGVLGAADGPAAL